MRFFALIFATAVAASAVDVQATVSATSKLQPSASSSPNGTRKGHRNKHHEHTPVFKTACICDKPIMPAGILSAKEQCNFKFYQDMSCYQQAQGGCPLPVLKC